MSLKYTEFNEDQLVGYLSRKLDNLPTKTIHSDPAAEGASDEVKWSATAQGLPAT